MAQRLFIDGDVLDLRGSDERGGPRDETLGERLGVEHREDAPEGIVTWDPVLQRQERLKLLALSLAEGFDAHPAIRTAEDRTDRNRQEVGELVKARTPWIGQDGEVREQAEIDGLVHEGTGEEVQPPDISARAMPLQGLLIGGFFAISGPSRRHDGSYPKPPRNDHRRPALRR